MIRQLVEKVDCIIFDCDGVLMDSNGVKEEAFATVTEKYFCSEAASFIRKDHREHGGISRKLKFQEVLGKFESNSHISLTALCDEFEKVSSKGVLDCSLANQLKSTLETLKRQGKRLLVLSGTPETGLREVLTKRGLGQYFDFILGSPTLKETHLKSLHRSRVLDPSTPFIFIGDSETDLLASKKFSNCRFFWSIEFGKVIKTNEEVNYLENLLPLGGA